jgi:LysM domain
MKRILSLLLALGLLGAVMAPAASAATCSAQYTVLPGDNLFRIGVAFGVPWPQIAAANNLTNPGLIFPGQVLCIPGVAGTPAATATGPTPTPTDTPTPSDTPTATATGPTPTPTDTSTPTDTPTATATGPTPTPTDTSTPTDTPTATATAQPTPIVTPTVTPAPSTFVIPTFSISSVVRDTSVTVLTANFPPGQDFVVTMGPLNSLGLGGVVVATTNSGAGGAFTATYNIPASLAGTGQISIRMQSASGYYSFNWFWNATAP